MQVSERPVPEPVQKVQETVPGEIAIVRKRRDLRSYSIHRLEELDALFRFIHKGQFDQTGRLLTEQIALTRYPPYTMRAKKKVDSRRTPLMACGRVPVIPNLSKNLTHHPVLVSQDFLRRDRDS